MSFLPDTPEARAITSQLRGTNIGVGLMTALFVILRFMARWQRRLKLGVDDYLMAVSLIFLAGGMADVEIAIDNGLGISAAELPTSQIMTIAKCLFVYEFIFLVYISTVKIAILVTYYRIFNHRRYKIATYIMSAVISSWCISFVFSSAFQCTPVSRNWDYATPGACLDFPIAFICNSIANILIDLTMLFMPIWEVWKLQMRVYQRVSLTILFLLGSFVVFTSCYRLYVLVTIDVHNSSFTEAPALIWSHIETCATSTSACLPILRPLVEIFLYKTGLRSKAPSHNAQNAWRSDMANAVSTVREHRIRSQAIQSTAERDWPPVANESSDEVPLKSIKVQTEIEQSRHGSSENSEAEAKYC